MSQFRVFDTATMQRGITRAVAVKMTCHRCGFVELKPKGSTKSFVGPGEESRRFRSMFERGGWHVVAQQAIAAGKARATDVTTPPKQGT